MTSSPELAPTIIAPRTPQRRTRGRTNTELYAWLFMRVSGILLVVLVLGHLL
ncbi:MAG: succinate dehydrogenase hydrophobic rane anchor protein, partial [Frankiales bacterium]|nr:succinate dehydrogenase hydrophobic rane anchor protein [Frankiales bacterium]